jgi:hypothetical protein
MGELCSEILRISHARGRISSDSEAIWDASELRSAGHEPRFESSGMRGAGFEPTNGLTDKVSYADLWSGSELRTRPKPCAFDQTWLPSLLNNSYYIPREQIKNLSGTSEYVNNDKTGCFEQFF